MEREVLSYCRICAAACGIAVTVDGDRVVRVRGDAGHPVSRGYTCSKGRGLAAWHHSDARLDHPRVHGRDVGVERRRSTTSRRCLRDTIAAHGADAVALYLATGLAYDSAGQVAAGRSSAHWAAPPSTRAVTVDNAPVLVAAELVDRQRDDEPAVGPDDAGLVAARRARTRSCRTATAPRCPIRSTTSATTGAKGGRLWVIDPRRTESAALADEHLATRPGTDVARARRARPGGARARRRRRRAAGVLRAGRRRGAPTRARPVHDRARAASAADVDPDGARRTGRRPVRATAGAWRSRAVPASLMGSDGILVEWLRWVLLIASGSLDHARRHAHSPGRAAVTCARPARRDRSPFPGPRAVPSCRESPTRSPRSPSPTRSRPATSASLFVTGGQPDRGAARTRPRACRVAPARRAGRRRRDRERAHRARDPRAPGDRRARAHRHLDVLAPLGAFGDAVHARRSCPQPATDGRCGGCSEVWRRGWASTCSAAPIPTRLTDELYLRGILERSPLDADDGVRGRTPRLRPPGGVRLGARDDAARRPWRTRADGVARAARRPPRARRRAWCSRRDANLAWSNSVRYGSGAGRCPIARRSGRRRRDRDRRRRPRHVVSEHGAVEVTVVVDERLRAGVVSLVHGRRGCSPGTLVSTRAEVDPLTTMPRTSGVAVRIAVSS